LITILFSPGKIGKDLEYLKGAVKEIGTTYFKELVAKYLPVCDATSFELLEEDLATIENLDREIIKYLKSKKLEITTVQKFHDMLDNFVIKKPYFHYGFNWGQPYGGPARAPVIRVVFKHTNMSKLVLERELPFLKKD
jgi:hypothetical protein